MRVRRHLWCRDASSLVVYEDMVNHDSCDGGFETVQNGRDEG